MLHDTFSSVFSRLKFQSFPGLELSTFHTTVQHSTIWTNQVQLNELVNTISIIVSYPVTYYLLMQIVH